VKLLGTTTPGDQVFEVASNTKRVSRYMAQETAFLNKLTIYCDGLGSGSGSQVVRGVVYDTVGNLIASGDEVVIQDGQRAGWVDLPFSAYVDGVPLIAGTKYDFGYLAGDNTNTMRVYGRTSVGV
jgi:hypothetical protein